MKMRKLLPNKLLPKKPRPTMWDKEPSTKAVSIKNEKRLENELGCRRTSGSGNTPFPSSKGDHTHPRIMFEAKETKHARISVGVRDIAKLYREASVVGKEPALVLSAYGLPDPLPKDWVVIPVDFFTELLEALDEKEGG